MSLKTKIGLVVCLMMGLILVVQAYGGPLRTYITVALLVVGALLSDWVISNHRRR
jgi:Flp pilus assembly protein TadB